MASTSSSTGPSGTVKTYHIRVPASTANLGPGFDVLGLALGLYLTLDVTLSPTSTHPTPILSYSGQGASDAPLDPYKNLITRVSLYVLRCHAIPAFPSGLTIHLTNAIPFGRGLGSSGAAVIAGVLLADALGQLSLSASRKLDFALMVERHPDNVAAALMGGFVGSYLRELGEEDERRKEVPLSEVLPEYPDDAGEKWGWSPSPPPEGIGHWIRYGWAEEVKALVIIPKFEVSTATARGALKKEYALKDVVFNLQRIAVLTTALTRSPPDPDLIFQAMQDRIHQPYRKNLIPALPTIISSFSPSSHPGLLGIALSGAGPTILALATANFEKIGGDVCELWKREGGVECETMVLEVDREGAGWREV